MASDWLLQTIYAALIGQAIVPSGPPPTTKPTGTADTNVLLNRPLVHAPCGDVLGVQKLTSSGSVIDTYLGIPFATPTVGKLRFDKPVPAPKWIGVRDASKFGNKCPQSPSRELSAKDAPVVASSEDCLYLNVYKPETVTASGELLPVMVWIHGGGFIFGAGSQYDSTNIAGNGVIVVTINYRLDILGFLSNEDDVIPGNYGMLDQVMALKWIRQNIKSFGGDPDKVTIFGESAGSASVSMLVLSPLAKGLFSRAIMESGTSLSTWGVHFPAARVTPSQITNLIGSSVGCNDRDSVKMLECLRNIDADTLVNASVAVADALNLFILMTPVVETKFGFLPDRPVNLWLQGKFNHVDTIRGFNKAENGREVLNRSNYSLSVQQFITGIKENLQQFAIIDIDEMIASLRQDYNVNPVSDHGNFMKLVDVLTDFSFRGGSILEANMESKMAPEKKRYVYEYDYKSSRSQTPSWMPPLHGEELESVFGPDKIEFERDQTGKLPSKNDQLMSKLVQRMWTNFAKYGTPTQTPSSSTGTGTILSTSGALSWSPYVGDGTANVLRIGLTSQEVSFRNSTSARAFQRVLKRLDTVVPDRFIVG